MKEILIWLLLYNNKINARVLIGQSAMVFGMLVEHSKNS